MLMLCHRSNGQFQIILAAITNEITNTFLPCLLTDSFCKMNPDLPNANPVPNNYTTHIRIYVSEGQ